MFLIFFNSILNRFYFDALTLSWVDLIMMHYDPEYSQDAHPSLAATKDVVDNLNVTWLVDFSLLIW